MKKEPIIIILVCFLAMTISFYRGYDYGYNTAKYDNNVLNLQSKEEIVNESKEITVEIEEKALNKLSRKFNETGIYEYSICLIGKNKEGEITIFDVDNTIIGDEDSTLIPPCKGDE